MASTGRRPAELVRAIGGSRAPSTARGAGFLCGVCALTMAAALPGAAYAQDATTAPTGQQIATDGTSDIIVTARRREESLQKVPVAVTVISGAQLIQKNITDIRGFAQSTPGLVLVQGPRSSTLFNASLRGQVSADSSINVDSPIGLYVDDVYIGRTSGAVTSLFDVEQVQVLRGVQGTLFGRNNTGGAILLSSVKPQQEFGAKVLVGAGNYDARRVDGAINVPIVRDKLAARVSGTYQKRDGWLRNLPDGRKFNGLDLWSVRGQLLFTPTDSLETILRYSHVTANNTVNMPVPTAPGLGFTPPPGFYQTDSDSNGKDRLRTDDVSLNSRLELSDAVSAKLVLAHRRVNLVSNTDGDGYPSPIFNITSTETQKQNSAELQLNGNAIDHRLNWVLGGFYFRETGDSIGLLPGLPRYQFAHGKNSSLAGFGHVDFEVFHRFSIGGGVRYTTEKRGLDVSVSNPRTNACLVPASVVDAPGVCLVSLGRRYRYWSWDATANYQVTDDILLYARAGKGQKAGGFNLVITSPSQTVPFLPEIAKDIELGAKAQFLDRAVTTNIALYRTRYTNIQRRRLVPDPPPATQRIDNASKATVKGIEVELRVHPVRPLSFEATFAYTDAKYSQFVLNGIDETGNAFPLVPKYTYTLGGSLTEPVGELGSLTLRADWAYRSRVEFIVVNRPGLDQPGFGMLNSRASFTLKDSGVSVALYGTNLLNKKTNVNATQLFPSFPYDLLYRGQPRQYGIELSFAFGGAR